MPVHSSPEQQASAAQDSQWREMRAVRVVRRDHPQRERNKHALGARDSRHTSGHSHTDMCRAATLEGVTARALLAIALAASSLACTALPSVTFVSDDASSGDGATSVEQRSASVRRDARRGLGAARLVWGDGLCTSIGCWAAAVGLGPRVSSRRSSSGNPVLREWNALHWPSMFDLQRVQLRSRSLLLRQRKRWGARSGDDLLERSD